MMMTLYLKKFTEFFKTINVKDAIYKKFEKKDINICELLKLPSEIWTDNVCTAYSSGILLKNMLQLICNGHAITKLNLTVSEVRNISTEYQCRIATAIYPSASMMNHSCNPNIVNR